MYCNVLESLIFFRFSFRARFRELIVCKRGESAEIGVAPMLLKHVCYRRQNRRVPLQYQAKLVSRAPETVCRHEGNGSVLF